MERNSISCDDMKPEDDEKDNIITIMDTFNMVQSLWWLLSSKDNIMDTANESNEISKNLLRNQY
jgi:hypothetical protein